MSLYIVSLILCSVVFSLYFFSGVFYIIRKPKIIITKKLCEIEKKYNITSIDDYLNNIGKLNIYVSIIILFGSIIAIYMDKIKYSISGSIFLFFSILLNSVIERKKRKYLVEKNTETIDK